MNIIYNSQNYVILAYPARLAFELVDKSASRTLFVQGSVAINLRNEDSIDDLLYD